MAEQLDERCPVHVGMLAHPSSSAQMETEGLHVPDHVPQLPVGRSFSAGGGKIPARSADRPAVRRGPSTVLMVPRAGRPHVR